MKPPVTLSLTGEQHELLRHFLLPGDGKEVVKIHSHPRGYAAFSDTDDAGDRQLLPMIRGWIEADIPHGSVVMLPDGQMFGRVLAPGGTFLPIDCVSVAGDDLHFWY